MLSRYILSKEEGLDVAGGSAQVQNMPVWEGGRPGGGGEGIACGRVRKGEGLREIFNREKHIKTEDRLV